MMNNTTQKIHSPNAAIYQDLAFPRFKVGKAIENAQFLRSGTITIICFPFGELPDEYTLEAFNTDPIRTSNAYKILRPRDKDERTVITTRKKIIDYVKTKLLRPLEEQEEKFAMLFLFYELLHTH